MIAVAVAAAIARGNPICDPSQLFPGAVATLDRSIGIFTVPAGGIQAVRLGTGAPIWRSSDAAWPLDVVGDEVLAAVPDKARPNAFEVVALSLDDGSPRFQSDLIELPTWAKPILSYDQPSGYRFDLTSELFDNHTVLIRWSARNWASHGQCGQKAIGNVQIDSQTGKIAKPFLGAQPGVLVTNLLSDRRPDLAEPNSHMVGPETKTDAYSVYLSESDQGNDAHPLKVVVVDPDTGRLLWDMPLGTRRCSSKISPELGS